MARLILGQSLADPADDVSDLTRLENTADTVAVEVALAQEISRLAAQCFVAGALDDAVERLQVFAAR